MTFREDESRIRRSNAPHNIGVIRHVAMDLLKREKTKDQLLEEKNSSGLER